METGSIAANREAVNKLISLSAGKPVLMHWFDMDERREPSRFGGGIKNKFPVEVQYFAIGILTGKTIFDKPWGFRHTKWILPTTGFKKAQLNSGELDWRPADEYPQSMGGTYPSLSTAEPTGHVPLGESSYRLARAMQIVVGKDAIHAWLTTHDHFRTYADIWFAQIVNQLEIESA